MKLTLLTTTTTLLALASAQGLGGLPKCAQNCALNSIPKDCGLDVKCICTADSFIDAITCCVADSCSAEEQERLIDGKETIQFAKGICGTAGITDIPDSAVCSTKTGAPTGSATGTPTGTHPASHSMEPTGTGAGAGAGTEAPKPTETGAAGRVGVGAGAGVMGVVGAVAMGLF
ncbi:hypothetical protein FQN50_001421 [Emmonsiellopsis sp. PD_5]|nr:hypothetical protein FQN50_001421 [Emmonsiellopsis sp. PD_5]